MTKNRSALLSTWPTKQKNVDGWMDNDDEDERVCPIISSLHFNDTF